MASKTMNAESQRTLPAALNPASLLLPNIRSIQHRNRQRNRFEHYELLEGADGKPVELGHGAMGVTYKAFDIDLHCHVTLKVITEKYLGDESARLRFFCAKPAPRRASITRMLARPSTWAESVRTTSLC